MSSVPQINHATISGKIKRMSTGLGDNGLRWAFIDLLNIQAYGSVKRTSTVKVHASGNIATYCEAELSVGVDVLVEGRIHGFYNRDKGQAEQYIEARLINRLEQVGY